MVRRSVGTLMAVCMVIAFCVFASGESTRNTMGQPAESYHEVIVEPGDTLWHIARDIAPDRDPRQVVWEIRQKNQMQQAIVYPGQVLKVPTPSVL